MRRLFHSRETGEVKDAQLSEVRVLSILTFQCQKVVRAGNIVVVDEKNPHIRNTRDGTMIKLDANNGAYTLTCGLASMKQVQFSVGKDSD